MLFPRSCRSRLTQCPRSLPRRHPSQDMPANGITYPINLALSQFRKHRQRKNATGQPFGDWERPLWARKISAGGLKMQGHRIMNASLYALGCQSGTQPITIIRLNDIGIIDMV